LITQGELSVVIIGVSVFAGVPKLGPLATGYVLELALAGPVLSRLVEPRSSRTTVPLPCLTAE
jgi:CPA2 family monovalent cation:H+ antiporter-2